MLKSLLTCFFLLSLVGCATQPSPKSSPSSPVPRATVLGNKLVSPERGRYQGVVQLRDLRALSLHYSSSLMQTSGRRLVLSFFEGGLLAGPYYASPDTRLVSGAPVCAVFSAVDASTYEALRVPGLSSEQFRQFALFGFLHEVGHCFRPIGASSFIQEFDPSISDSAVSELYADLFALSQMRCFVSQSDLDEIAGAVFKMRGFWKNILYVNGHKYTYGDSLAKLYPSALSSPAFFSEMLSCPPIPDIDLVNK